MKYEVGDICQNGEVEGQRQKRQQEEVKHPESD
jgi:hypothetical protein